jgi:asparaginyl-tRNA synthetase
MIKTSTAVTWRHDRPRIRELLSWQRAPQVVSVEGWVRTMRQGKGMAFLAVNDGSCLQSLQVVVETATAMATVLKQVGTGSCIRVRGRLVESPAAGQHWEVLADELKLLGPVDEDYPLQKKRHSLEFLREIAHLRPRTNLFGAVFRIRSRLAFAIHRFFQERGFLYVHTPIITANDCEGAGEMFRVTTLDPFRPPVGNGQDAWREDFFGEKAGLTVSGQLEGELFALACTDIYTFGPTFRAENSNTSRHAAEFWMIEPEMAFADLAADCALAEEFFRNLVNSALGECAEDLAFLEQYVAPGLLARLELIAGANFERMTYGEAVAQLQRSNQSFTFPVAWGNDLQSEHERFLTENVVGGPLFVTDYPSELKAFYMRLNDDGRTVAAMDLLVPRVGEIIGGSQREERPEILAQRMRNAGVSPESLAWYLETRRWGSCPHAGFGLGFERFLMYVTGVENIRDVIPFPRTPGHARF